MGFSVEYLITKILNRYSPTSSGHTQFLYIYGCVCLFFCKDSSFSSIESELVDDLPEPFQVKHFY